MDKLINWLFQRTMDGATYLQAIILSAILCALVFALVVNINSIFRDLKKGVVSNDKEKL